MNPRPRRAIQNQNFHFNQDQRGRFQQIQPLRIKQPRGFNTIFQNAVQRGIIKGLKRKNNKRTCYPGRTFKIEVSERIVSHLKSHYELNNFKKANQKLWNDLKLFDEINSINHKANNTITHKIKQGTLTFRINKKSSITYKKKIDNSLKNHKLPNPASITVGFTKETQCLPSLIQQKRIDDFLGNHHKQ